MLEIIQHTMKVGLPPVRGEDRSWIIEWMNILDLVFPPFCVGCGK